MHINRSVRLDPGEYVAERVTKTGIAIHHTVGGTVASTVAWWRADKTADGKPRPVGTAYLIERDGTVFEAFDPEAWAFQFGLSWPRARKLAFEKRFIGIELASEGALTERDGLLYAFDRISPKTLVDPAAAFDYGEDYRGYRWFDHFEPAQVAALGALVDHLCTRFAIPRRYPDRPLDYYGEKLAAFDGVIGHAMVRSDKTDPAPDVTLWQSLERAAGLVPAAIPPLAARASSSRLSQRDRDLLFQENARRLNAMDTDAGSLVKTLLMELERRKVYLALHDPAPDGHAVGYTLVGGESGIVARIGRALGFQTTDGLLEVRHA